MTRKILAPLALLPLLAACADEPDPWLAQAAVAADARPGAETLVNTHEAALGRDCAPGEAPEIVVLEPGTLGEIYTRATSVTIENEVDEETGEPIEDLECAGTVVPATAVWYQAGTAIGIDRLVYRELTDRARPSRDWLASVRVR